ncbi:MAG: lactate racemase domain-containing protein [Candidatus Sigynarchaeota archaeon]
MSYSTSTRSIRWGTEYLTFDLPANARVEDVSPTVCSRSGKSMDCHEMEVTKKHIAAELAKLRSKIDESARILVASDDNTRVTPAKILLPPIIDAARIAGKPVSIIVAGGSHRHMNREEKREKFGAAIVDEIPIIDHEWSDDSALVNFGKARGGYDLKLARIACEPGTFLIGIGNIVPHRVCGFSGGYKILLPGLTCQDTMNRIHYSSAAYPSEQILGVAGNPVRDAINEIGIHRPIDFLVNTVLDGGSNIVSLCLGDPIESQYQGAAIAKKIYGVPVGIPADIVIADTVPEHIDWWLCAKAACNCKSFVRPGGHLVLLAPCTEGWSPVHERILLEYGYHPPAEIDAMVKDGRIPPAHMLEASHLAHIGEVLAHCHVHIVSNTLDKDAIDKQGFDVVRSRDFPALVHELVAGQQKTATGHATRVKIVCRGAEILPIV